MNSQLVLLISLAAANCKVCVNPADIVFAIDASRSIWGPNFEQQLRFVKEIVDSFEIGPNATQIGAFTFGDKISLEFNLNKYRMKGDVQAAIGQVRHAEGGLTLTHDALGYARKVMFSPDNGARAGLPHILIVLTDGRSTMQPETQTEAASTKASGIQIFGIGVGREVDADELKKMVSSPSSNFLFLVPTYGELESGSIKKQLGTRACDVTTPAPTEAATTKEATTAAGPTTTERMSNDESTAREVCQGKPADIIFVLDTSSSIMPDDFTTQTQFVVDVVNILDINQNKTQVGLITFSDNATVGFYLDQYSSGASVAAAVKSTPHTGGRTNTGDALRLLLEEGFSSRHGARTGVAQIAIVITDGLSRVPEETVVNAGKVKDSGIYVFAIGVGANADKGELGAMASTPTADYLFTVDGYGALDTIKSILAYKTCAVKVVEKPSGDIATCTAKGPTDVIFGIDVSNVGGIDSSNILDFVRNTSGAFVTESGKIRVGLARTDCPKDASKDIQLGQFVSRQEFVNAIDGSFRASLTPLINKVRMKSFSSTSGGRQGAKKVLVLVVPGGVADLKMAQREASRAKFAKIEVFAVGVGPGVSKSDLEPLVSSPTMSHTFLVGNSAGLDSLVKRFLLTVCKGL
ncbi:hypothetical protein ScPMuIL_006019 [Solemya velum]